MSQQRRRAGGSPAPVRHVPRGIQRREFRATRPLHSAHFAPHLGPAVRPAARRRRGCKLRCRVPDDPVPTSVAAQVKAETSGAVPHSRLTRGSLIPRLGLRTCLPYLAYGSPSPNSAFDLPSRIWRICNFVIWPVRNLLILPNLHFNRCVSASFSFQNAQEVADFKSLASVSASELGKEIIVES